MRIDHIFISHLHGDHYLGLAGLLFSLHLLGRKKALHVVSPPGLKEIIDMQYKVSSLKPVYETIFHEISDGRELIYEDKSLTVETIAMQHRIPCYGFLFKEKPSEKNILKQAIEEFDIPVSAIRRIKQGDDFLTSDGRLILNEMLTNAGPRPRTYAFCSDTAYTERFLDQIEGADLMYHEATFLHDKADIARQKTHATTVEAATLASKAKAGKLLLGHYSARYKDLALFRKEAMEVFQHTHLAEEGDVHQVGESLQ